MKVSEASLKGVFIIEPDVFSDKRGFFLETFHQQRYGQSGIDPVFVQDNISYSTRGTLRGLHYQHPHEQAKLVQVLEGEIFDVAVDIRHGSPTFGQWTATNLSDKNKRQLFIPEGLAHGFCVLSDTAFVMYKCSDFYAPNCEGGILWCDPGLRINWPIKAPVLSGKDSRYPFLRDVPAGSLPAFHG